MKQKKSPMQGILEGKNGKLIYGGTIRQSADTGYKALIGLFVGIAGLFALIAAGALAVKQGMDAVDKAIKDHPQQVQGFKKAVEILARISDKLPD